MILIDTLLLAPGKAAFAVLSEVAKKAQQEWLDDAPIKQTLRDLYMLFDAGRISSQEFDTRERLLLERLQEIAKLKSEVE